MNGRSTADPQRSGSIARRSIPRVAARRALVPLALIAAVLSGATYGQTAHLQIYHINVEQGDATLFLCPDGRTLLIDGGNTGKGRNIIVPLLQTIGVESLDYVIATHYDADHIGGLDEVVDALGPPAVAAWDRGNEALPLTSSVPPTVTRAYAEYVRSVGRTRRTIRLGERFEIGGVRFTCIAVNGRIHQNEAVPKRRLDENSRSVALRVKFGEFDYFTAGDLTGGGYSGSRRTADVESLAADQVADVDVLRVNHHGSSTSSCEPFLDILRPDPELSAAHTADRPRPSARTGPGQLRLTRVAPIGDGLSGFPG